MPSDRNGDHMSREHFGWVLTSILLHMLARGAHLVEASHLLDRVIVQEHDVLGADVVGAVSLQQEELVSDGDQPFEDLLLDIVLRRWDGRRVHGLLQKGWPTLVPAQV